MMYLIKLFYLGEPYTGFQRQPSGKTVENMLEKALIELDLIESLRHAEYQSASRTDAGVNAIGNVISLNLNRQPNLQQINSELPKDGSIFLWAWAQVNKGYRIRPTLGKTYSYNIPYADESILQNFYRIKLFEGEHDFRRFIKKDKVERPTKCNIKEINYTARGRSIEVEITGDHFGWEMIRRIIGFVMDPRYLGKDPRDFLDGGYEVIHVHPAPAKFLSLKHVFLREEPKWNLVDVRRRIKKYKRVKEDRVSLIQSQIKLYDLLEKGVGSKNLEANDDKFLNS